MSEAPKILWYDVQECSAGAAQFYPDEVKYVRADIVEEMRRAMIAYMKRFPSVFGAPYRVVDDYKKAIKLLEEE